MVDVSKRDAIDTRYSVTKPTKHIMIHHVTQQHYHKTNFNEAIVLVGIIYILLISQILCQEQRLIAAPRTKRINNFLLMNVCDQDRNIMVQKYLVC